METTQNTFEGGLILDSNIATTPKNVLSNALNATISTFNGNEQILQNDMGNVRIPYHLDNGETSYACLTETFVPIGLKVFGNIMYIISYSKERGLGEVGCFPSPDWDAKKGKLIYKYSPLKIGITENGSLYDLRSEYFNFDLNHPVEVLAEDSYDGSVNLIFTDNKNNPKLINTGFQARENGEYYIIDRIGDDSVHTNRYRLDDKTLFNLQTSLYRDSHKIPKIQFNGLQTGGQLKVGTYTIYVIACDKDGNESDIICESGVIPVFLGTDGDPFSVNGGSENQVSDKSIDLTITNIDSAYHYVKLCYTRTAAANNQNASTLAYKVQTLFPVTKDGGNSIIHIIFTGFEDEVAMAITDLNIRYFNADTVKTQCLTQNMLFQGNIAENYKNDNEYDELRTISLQVYPMLDASKRVNLSSSYEYDEGEEQNSYYNSKFCYESTGYHIGEFYRFGIVYIRQDNSLTSVFDVLGVNELTEKTSQDTLKAIKLVSQSQIDYNNESSLSDQHCNIFGVSRINQGTDWDQMTVVGIKFNIEALQNTYIQENYKGYFFVRQKRIPTLLAQAYTTNVCEDAYVPSINLQSDINGEARYLYESFMGGSFYELPNDIDSAFYPKNISHENKPRLFNAYSRRLFSLTDHTRIYRDKKVLGNVSYNAFVKEYGQSIRNNKEFWYSGYRVWQKEDSDFIGIFANNVNTLNYDNDRHFWCYALFATKISSEEAAELDSIGSNYVAKECSPTENQKFTAQGYVPIDFASGGKEPTRVTNVREGLYQKYWYDKGFDNVNKTLKDYTPVCRYVKFNGITYRVDAEGYGQNAQNQSNVINILTQFINKCINKEYTPSSYKDFHFTYIREIVVDPNDTGIIEETVYDNKEDISTYDGKYEYPKSYEDSDEYSLYFHPMEFNSYAAFCPEYDLYKAHYNNFFTGGNLVAKFATTEAFLNTSENSRRYTYENQELEKTQNKTYTTKILGVEEDITICSINLGMNNPVEVGKSYLRHNEAAYFSTKCGSDKDFTFRFAGAKFLGYVFPDEKSAKIDISKPNTYQTTINRDDRIYMLNQHVPFNVLRGKYGPYLGCYPIEEYVYNTEGDTKKRAVKDFANRIVNIYIPNYSTDQFEQYRELRYHDKSEYYAISDRMEMSTNLVETDSLYRGDCFIGWFTHRVNRNFNDATAPYNDEILSPSSVESLFSKDIFDVEYRRIEASTGNDSSGSSDPAGAKAALKINVGDLNAVQMGSWVTFPVRSSMNISIRSTDESWTDEKHQSGNSRSFYPLHSVDASGSYKMPESDNYNSAFSKSGSDRQYWNQNNTIFDNSYYKNRITYSNIMVNGSFENGNRTFLATHFRDYTDQYGAIVKILTLSGDLLVVCEHGILALAVKERVQAGNGNNGLVFINSPNVLPENSVIISDTYGSTWPESIIQTPYGVFGVDAVAKKIWYTNGTTHGFQLISDFRIQSFLNKGLSMWNKELELNKTNIKSHYNAFKNDVMFTAYDYNNVDVVGRDYNEDVMWNICYNLNSAHSGNGWQTFYSWIPSFSGNIGNNFITFNHETDKKIIDDVDDTRFTYLWKHGQSDFVPDMERILPTKWYGEQHPFEFEFVVNNNPINHKIFNDLRIISNKAAPESFHYEVIGQCYDLDHIKMPPGSFKEQISDKPNMYYRQELTKAFYQICMGSNIKYNKNFKDVVPVEVFKSTMFPLYYSRKGNYNKIYDSYQALTANGYEYQNLSGGEIIYDQLLNEFKICNHVQGVDITKNGRLRGNMHYKEDIWYVQIPSINYVQKNEYLNSHLDDNNPKLKLALGNNPVPEDIKDFPEELNIDPLNTRLQLNYTGNDITFDKWDAGRHEMRIKDKYLRIKVRYSGEDLAVISGILTLYTNSYS